MAAMPSPGSRQWLRRGLVAAAVVVVALGGVAAFILSHAPGNVSHPDLQFTRPSTTTAPVRKAPPAVVVDKFQWPWYGYDNGRTRFLQTPARLAPPLRIGWHFFDGALLEFPPVIDRQRLYTLDDDADAKAINAVTGRQIWQHKVGTLAASSPAVADQAGLVLMPVLSTAGHAPGAGRFVALSMKTGRIVWSRPLGPGSESSPIVNGNTVYYGDQGGTLYARRITDGHLFWTYHASGAIKGGPALASGVLYFGDYAGRAYAVRAGNGRQVWAVGTNGAHFGFGSGQFYSTPAVAFGRVYMGNTDGRVYSFGARTGALAWATATGAYVYASAAVANPPGLGPTVYVGSYDGHLYAFNAQSGAIRWSHAAGGRISGSATVLGRVVYYANLGAKTTAGLDVVTGRQVFSFHDGAFNPVIADYHAIYLVGYNTIYQLLPVPSAPPKPKSANHRHRSGSKPRRQGARATSRRSPRGSHRSHSRRSQPRRARPRRSPPGHKRTPTRK